MPSEFLPSPAALAECTLSLTICSLHSVLQSMCHAAHEPAGEKITASEIFDLMGAYQSTLSPSLSESGLLFDMFWRGLIFVSPALSCVL